MAAVESIFVRRILGCFLNQPIDLRNLKEEIKTYVLITDRLGDKYDIKYYASVYNECRDHNKELTKLFEESKYEYEN